MERKTYAVQLSDEEARDVLKRARKESGQDFEKLSPAVRFLLGLSDVKAGAPKGNKNAAGNSGRWGKTQDPPSEAGKLFAEKYAIPSKK